MLGTYTISYFQIRVIIVAWIDFMNSQYWVGKNLVTWHGAEVSDSFVYMFAYFSLCIQTKTKKTLVFA